MTRTKYNWRDRGDFDSEHDRIALWLDQNWLEYIECIVEDANGESVYYKTDDKINPEPVLLGNPRLYPDAITIIKIPRDNIEISQAIIFEIKPRIDSLGEVVRQINDYRVRSGEKRFFEQFGIQKKWTEPAIMVLVTDDNRYDAYLLKHGYFVIHPYWTDPSDPRNESESISSPSGQDNTKEAL